MSVETENVGCPQFKKRANYFIVEQIKKIKRQKKKQ
jgi:hypothetical protein